MTRSIRLRLFIFALAGIAVALGIAGVGLTTLFGRHVERRIGEELDLNIAQIAGNLRVVDGRITLAREPADPRFHQPLAGLYWQIDDRSTATLTRSRSLWDATLDVPDAAPAPGATAVGTSRGADGEPLILHERMVLIGDTGHERPVRISVAINRSEIEPLKAGFARDLLPGLAILGLVLAAGAWLQVAAGLRPLRRVGAGVAAVHLGTESRLKDDVPREIAPLVGSINELLEQRDEMVSRARDRAADLAHGLKTPLSALAGDAARLRARGERELAADIETLWTQMKRSIDRELARSRLRHRGPHAGRVLLRPSVEAIVRTLSRTPAGETVAFDIDVADDLVVAALPDDLAEVLGNLLENAVRAARTRVRVAATSSAAGAEIAIEDDGDGVGADQVALLVLRGRRLDEGGGAGLGLAIVSEILANYDTRPAFSRSELGGLRVVFSLPR